MDPTYPATWPPSPVDAPGPAPIEGSGPVPVARERSGTGPAHPRVVLVRRRAWPDFTAVLPLLTDERRDWLAGAISLTYGTRHRPARATAG
ncbi:MULTISPECIES: hypothetical protein [Streptomyces]|uniref:hypothetical protein n=1 Tax=Streptomyces TaxID=1883 RepID=UPI0010721CE3|nr:hypothetical protein [Streptomyces sp. 4R-3d]TFI27228.1 hypothetical protein E4P36_13990 [Streptomyces sp. 4R-3d]